MADEHNNPEEYLPLGAEIVDSEKPFWQPDLQPYIDERHKCIWALGELNNRYAKIIFELKAIEDFVQDWFRVTGSMISRELSIMQCVKHGVLGSWH